MEPFFTWLHVSNPFNVYISIHNCKTYYTSIPPLYIHTRRTNILWLLILFNVSCSYSLMNPLNIMSEGELYMGGFVLLKFIEPVTFARCTVYICIA